MPFFEDLARFWTNYWVILSKSQILPPASSFEERRAALPLVSPRELFTGINVTLNKMVAASQISAWPAPDQPEAHTFIPTSEPEGMIQDFAQLSIQHSLSLNPEPQNPQSPPTEYSFGMTSVSPFGHMMARIDSSKNFMTHLGIIVSASTIFDLHYYSAQNLFITELKHLSADSVYRVSCGQMGRVAMSYWRPIRRRLAAGASFDYNFNERKSNFALAARLRRPMREYGVEYHLKDTGGSNDQEFKFWHSKKVTDRATLGADLSVNLTQRTATYRAGFAYSFSNGRVRTTIDPKLRLMSMLEFRIQQYSLALAIDSLPEKGDYKIGLAFQS